MAAGKTIYILCVVLFAAVFCQEAQGDPEEDQNDVNNFSFGIPCNYTEIPGSTCLDCNNRLICTKVGGFVKPCWFPFRRFCVDGRCSAQPSQECLPTSPEPPTTTEEEPVDPEEPTDPEEPSLL